MRRSLLLTLALLGLGCSEPPPPAPTPAPTPTADPDRYRDVFKPLDGDWVGKFRIYVDGRGQQDGPRPTTFDAAVYAKPPYRLELEIDVKQTYVSESPFFQRVTIVDTYTDGQGKRRVVTSKGLNKVEQGELWCIVEKPNDRVVHRGTLVGRSTLIWQRDRKQPLAIEYFEETVAQDRYTILGYGYYGDDDPTKAPKRFFVAEYRRP